MAEPQADARAGAGATMPLESLDSALGVTFSDAALRVAALTHRSFAFERGLTVTNERLEFLGDSVLGLVVTDMAYAAYPDMPEGALAKLRAAIVNMSALADVARSLRLGDLVLLGKGEEQSGGRDKSSILADALEAVFGAVYLDQMLVQSADPVPVAVVKDPPAYVPASAYTAASNRGVPSSFRAITSQIVLPPNGGRPARQWNAVAPRP